MNAHVRRLASDPSNFLFDLAQNRTACPAGCDGGTVWSVQECESRWSPGWFDALPCPRCEGRGYLLRTLRRVRPQQVAA